MSIDTLSLFAKGNRVYATHEVSGVFLFGRSFERHVTPTSVGGSLSDSLHSIKRGGWEDTCIPNGPL